MKTELQEAMTAGVFVEFRDEQGHTVGQAVFTDWRGRPVPAVGDRLSCRVHCSTTSRDRKLAGRVVSRHFEVQQDDDQPSVWVRLVLQVVGPRVDAVPAAMPVWFSMN